MSILLGFSQETEPIECSCMCLYVYMYICRKRKREKGKERQRDWDVKKLKYIIVEDYSSAEWTGGLENREEL
jgi:hypothetical protein